MRAVCRRQPLLRARGGGAALRLGRADSRGPDALLARRARAEHVPHHTVQPAARLGGLRRGAAAGGRAHGVAHTAVFALARRAVPGGHGSRPHVSVAVGGARPGASRCGAPSGPATPLAPPGGSAAGRLRAGRACGRRRGGGQRGTARRRRRATHHAASLQLFPRRQATPHAHPGARRPRQLAACLQRWRVSGAAGCAGCRHRRGAAGRVGHHRRARRGRAPAARAPGGHELNLCHRRTAQLA
mmetsp:Transcript_2831/g.9575  ORF Transcript_2831/g.9575 Transcript_2831/m.9575 type:complete len:243 (+) Transcript_2831:2305-3033(+)